MRESLRPLRDHAVALARTEIWDRVAELKTLQQNNPSDFAVQSAKDSILVRLKRLMPGQSNAIPALRDKRNQVTTDPAEMASILNEHWGAKFSRRGVAR